MRSTNSFLSIFCFIWKIQDKINFTYVISLYFLLQNMPFWTKSASKIVILEKYCIIRIIFDCMCFILSDFGKNYTHFHKTRKNYPHLYETCKNHPHADKTRKNGIHFNKTRKNHLHKFQFTSKLYSINRNHVKINLIAAICAKNSFI